MRPPKLIQQLTADAGGMSEQLFEMICNSRKCSDLVFRTPAEEHNEYAMGVYHDLVESLETETDSSFEHRRVAPGQLRAALLGYQKAGMAEVMDSQGVFQHKA